MAKMFTTIPMCLILVIFLDSALAAIECYNCDKHDKCTDPFNKEDIPVETCYGYCMKLKAASDNSAIQVKVGDVLRGCATLRTEPTCHEDAEYLGMKGVACLCDTDLCNGSDVSEISTATGIMAAIAILEIIF